MASFPYFNWTGSVVPYTFVFVNWWNNLKHGKLIIRGAQAGYTMREIAFLLILFYLPSSVARTLSPFLGISWTFSITCNGVLLPTLVLIATVVFQTWHCGPAPHYSVDSPIQTYTEPVPLKYGKLATKYRWICGYFCSVDCRRATVYSVQYWAIIDCCCCCCI